jgi:uncharacterized membrane protein
MSGKKIIIIIGVVTVGFLLILLSKQGSNASNDLNDNINKPNTKEEMSYDEVKIRKSDITSQARFYPVTIDGVEMEVIAVRASDDTIRTAFNACQVCADSGRGYYIQQGRKLVCQNCGNQFDIDEIEIVRGGCNPAPITRDEKIDDGEFIIIPSDTLKANEYLFNY